MYLYFMILQKVHDNTDIYDNEYRGLWHFIWNIE